MKLLELRAENFAKLVAVEIRPDGNLVAITGRNAQGKTTVLKAIWSLVKGRAAAPPVAIRAGTEEASLYGDFGAFKVTRTISRAADGSESWTLKVIDDSGKRITKTPQSVIDGWLGELTLDPLQFARMTEKAQFDLLKTLVKGYDFDAKAKERKDLFDERTDVNRRAHASRSAADRIALPPGREPQRVDIAAIVTELQAAERGNLARVQEIERRKQSAAQIDVMRDEAESLRARAASLEKTADEREAELKALPTIPAAVDTSELVAKIDNARHIGETVALFEQRRHHEKTAKEAEDLAADLTARIAKLDEEKTAAIEAAKLPVKNLTLGDGEVIYRGVPLVQASTMEKIMVGAALGMAMKPELKVMTIDEASELDSHALETLRKLAEKHGFDIWFTKVDESGEVGFVIVDGEVAS